MKHFLVLLLCLISLTCTAKKTSDNFLFKSGKSEYVIVADTLVGSSSDRTGYAVSELRRYLYEISSVSIPVCTRPRSRRCIYVGFSDFVEGKMKQAGISLDKDGSFCYFSDSGGNIFICGKGRHGTLYGVYAFLENELGCRWYTSDYELVLQKSSFSFSRLFRKESPAIARRYVMYAEASDPEWCDKNRNNGLYDFFACHTFDILFPADKYFEKHPECFSMINGKRLSKDSQLCLSNPQVVKIVTANLLKFIEKYPDYLFYDVSQNDNLNYCRCPDCQALASKYGGQSGVMLHFVNQVAAQVAEWYPDKYVSTFAYTYTRKPPTGIRPASNVVVRLCSIECCFAHSFCDCPQNASFVNDVREWRKLTDKLYVWDYVTNFAGYCLPNPNFSALQPNIRFLRDNNVIGVLDEGDYQGVGGEFAQLRSYLLAKLLWNPDIDVDSVVNDFMSGYYGKGWKYVRQYWDLLLSIPGEDGHFGFNFTCHHKMYDNSFISTAKSYFEKALAAAENQQVRERVERAMMPVCYLECKRSPWRAKRDGAFAVVKRVIERDGIQYLYECYGNKPDAEDFIRSME